MVPVVRGDIFECFTNSLGEQEDVVRLTIMLEKQVTPAVAMQCSIIMLHSSLTVLSRYKSTDNITVAPDKLTLTIMSV